jgi:AmmeMemoRadiSam system protein A
MPSTELSEPSAPAAPLSRAERATLLDVARGAIAAALLGRPFAAPPWEPGSRLGEPGASFVTLTRRDELRGCVGTLEPRRPLAEDVAENARAAAFRDPRFPPITVHEWDAIAIHVSVLGPAEPLAAASEAELLAALRPGRDGLILEEGLRRATFLPAVWESLPDPRDFLAQLRRKAGLPLDHWSPTLAFRRYEVEEFG